MANDASNSVDCSAMRRVAFALIIILLTGILPTGCNRGGGREKVLNVYIWSEYLPQSVIDAFTQKTGIKVRVDLYDSNEALHAKLESGSADYDIVVPSDYMVGILAKQKLIRPLDRTKLPNFSNLDAAYLDKPFDADNQFSVPYFWGTTGLAYNKQKIPGTVDSWDVMFDRANAGQILMLDDAPECFAVALKRAGKSINSTDPQALAAAAQMLKDQKPLVKTYNSNDFADILAAGDVSIAHGFNGQFAKIVTANPDKFAYVLPKEGGTFWMDNLAIPTSAGNVEGAHQFINFILEAKANADITNAVSYASPNRAARAYIKPEILNNPDIYPPESGLPKYEFLQDRGEATQLLDKYWTEIKAQ